jgi:CRISPR-associated endoribonuclease Cas6
MFVRMTGLDPGVSTSLTAVLLDDPPDVWRLNGHHFVVQESICDPARHSWSGQTSYEALAAKQLTQADQLDRQVTLEFTSPTAFQSKEMTMPLILSPEMRHYGEEMMAISRYRLESRAVEQKNQAVRIGAVGQMTYRALGADRYWLGVINLLADFAFYSGVGVQTTTGMGQVRRR